ncbi:hypothetical protein SLEP1_g42479 [Rubroshorea leprosula]|uniref:Uncharacterized protein n=1 Tax=Rubroshorea leprosula TaxID=152421 RepID=A0AAV5L9Z4_9ROSI|nr:hypothetical protein SLEP1_g42479 [Rubroshorea leprosula]
MPDKALGNASNKVTHEGDTLNKVTQNMPDEAFKGVHRMRVIHVGQGIKRSTSDEVTHERDAPNKDCHAPEPKSEDATDAVHS